MMKDEAIDQLQVTSVKAKINAHFAELNKRSEWKKFVEEVRFRWLMGVTRFRNWLTHNEYYNLGRYHAVEQILDDIDFGYTTDMIRSKIIHGNYDDKLRHIDHVDDDEENDE